MNEDQATAVANALSGETWQSGGDIWLVLVKRSDGHVIAITDESINEYDSEEAFEEGQSSKTINLVS
jgi:hypothetical protein